MQTQGYTPKELVEAGLAREREASRGGGLYDFFRNRAIFPIRDARGQTIGFGGRELGGGQPKYLNTPQTVLFDKSATLYGLDLAREGIKRGNRVVIVEGYMDVVLPHQYGFRNVVACIGSAITEKHIRQIKKLTRRVALALDPDAAGESAMVRGIAVAQEAFDRKAVPVPGAAPGAATNRRGEPKGIVRFEEQVDAEITVVRLPPHEDPDEFVRRDAQGWASGRRAGAAADRLPDRGADRRSGAGDAAGQDGGDATAAADHRRGARPHALGRLRGTARREGAAGQDRSATRPGAGAATAGSRGAGPPGTPRRGRKERPRPNRRICRAIGR